MATDDSRPGPRGDEAALFREFNDELVRLVSHAVGTTASQTIEDACSFAWAQFLQYQPDRELNWRGWLFRTAQREAWMLDAQAREHKVMRMFEWEDPGMTEQLVAPNTLEINRDVHDALLDHRQAQAASAADRSAARSRLAAHGHLRNHW